LILLWLSPGTEGRGGRKQVSAASAALADLSFQGIIDVLSEDARMVTGQAWNSCGGMMMV
jgi:hypothetical protein